MITYKPCTEVTMEEIFAAFSLGFSDYAIQFTADQEVFAARFFGPEGNTLDLSFIALDQDRPIGLVLGGIRSFDGLRTMRCGTLCVAPAYRGQGISHRLFELHKAAAVKEQCKQLFLEVLKENHRAIKFYEKHGYHIVYDMKYYSSTVQPIYDAESALSYTLSEISFDTLEDFRKSLPYCHINWQSDTPFYAASNKEVFLGMQDGSKQIAMIAMSPQGKINFIWVDPAYRSQGLGRRLIQEAAQKHKVEKVTICLPSNAFLEGFLRKMNFKKEAVEQYEMYLPL